MEVDGSMPRDREAFVFEFKNGEWRIFSLCLDSAGEKKKKERDF